MEYHNYLSAPLRLTECETGQCNSLPEDRSQRIFRAGEQCAECLQQTISQCRKCPNGHLQRGSSCEWCNRPITLRPISRMSLGASLSPQRNEMSGWNYPPPVNSSQQTFPASLSTTLHQMTNCERGQCHSDPMDRRHRFLGSEQCRECQTQEISQTRFCPDGHAFRGAVCYRCNQPAALASMSTVSSGVPWSPQLDASSQQNFLPPIASLLQIPQTSMPPPPVPGFIGPAPVSQRQMDRTRCWGLYCGALLPDRRSVGLGLCDECTTESRTLRSKMANSAFKSSGVCNYCDSETTDRASAVCSVHSAYQAPAAMLPNYGSPGWN